MATGKPKPKSALDKLEERAKTVLREGRDVITAAGTALNPVATKKAKDEFQANRFKQAAWENFDKQKSELGKAITKGTKGTRSTIHKTNIKGY